MLTLHDLQTGFRHAVLGGDEAPAAAAILGDGLDPAARLAIYRNHVFASLTSVLKTTFPVVCRLVHERFFAYAAHEFIRDQPPTRPCLFEYGAAFPAFLESFPPCHGLPYLRGVAELEWALNVAHTAARVPPTAPADLAAVAAADAPRLRLTLAPWFALLASPWPVDRIWLVNQPGAAHQPVDLDTGGVRLAVGRIDGSAGFRVIDPATHVFVAALREGRTLEDAAVAALDRDRLFDLALTLRRLLADGAIVGFGLAS